MLQLSLQEIACELIISQFFLLGGLYYAGSLDQYLDCKGPIFSTILKVDKNVTIYGTALTQCYHI